MAANLIGARNQLRAIGYSAEANLIHLRGFVVILGGPLYSDLQSVYTFISQYALQYGVNDPGGAAG